MVSTCLPMKYGPTILPKQFNEVNIASDEFKYTHFQNDKFCQIRLSFDATKLIIIVATPQKTQLIYNNQIYDVEDKSIADTIDFLLDFAESVFDLQSLFVAKIKEKIIKLYNVHNL